MNKFLCLLVLSLSSFEIYSEDKDYKYLICKPANKLFTPKDDDEKNTFITFYKTSKEVIDNTDIYPKKSLRDGIQVTLSERKVKEKVGDEYVWLMYEWEFFAVDKSDFYSSYSLKEEGYGMSLDRKTLKLNHRSSKNQPYSIKSTDSNCNLVSSTKHSTNLWKIVFRLMEREEQINNKHEDELQI